MYVLLPFLLLIFAAIISPAQVEELAVLRELTINAKNDSERVSANEVFIRTLEPMLQTKESVSLDFDSVKQIGLLDSPDKKFRMITWNLPLDDGTHKYFCYLQTFHHKKKTYSLYKLNDTSADISSPEKKVFGKDHWYGALYYQVIPVSYKSKTWYTLLGWDGNSDLTRKKIIEVMYFAPNGEPRFGDDIFMQDKFTRKRVIFEYSARAVMSLKYHPEKNQIVFDHLSPSQPEMEGIYQYYGPDLSFDAYEWNTGKWVYKEDVDARLDTENPIYNPEIKSKEKKVYDPK